jgi:glutamine amidotransferase
MSRIALIDYGAGNLHSVNKALERVGAEVVRAADPDAMEGADAVVLPGVGAFGDCVAALHRRGLFGPLRSWVAADRPYLGICLGYQILFEGSDESPEAEGLARFGGRVRRFSAPGLKVPQIGWNALAFPDPGYFLWQKVSPPAFVYFVHSYFPVPDDPALVTATAEYGETFAAAAGRGSVAGVQFHPEKSQATGLAMLGNFVAACAAGTFAPPPAAGAA